MRGEHALEMDIKHICRCRRCPVDNGDENPCVKAREMSGKGKAEEQTAPAKAKDQKNKTEKESEGFGSKIKRLFSKPDN